MELVHWTVQYYKGIAPRERERTAKQLTLAERDEILRALAAGWSLLEIGQHLKHSASTISREVARNGGAQAHRAPAAEQAAWARAKRPKTCLLARNEPLRKLVSSKLQQDWLPQQVAAWLCCEHHNPPDMQVSHETIWMHAAISPSLWAWSLWVSASSSWPSTCSCLSSYASVIIPYCLASRLPNLLRLMPCRMRILIKRRVQKCKDRLGRRPQVQRGFTCAVWPTQRRPP